MLACAAYCNAASKTDLRTSTCSQKSGECDDHMVLRSDDLMLKKHFTHLGVDQKFLLNDSAP